MLQLSLVDYGAGNLKSVYQALTVSSRSCAQEIGLTVTSDPQTVAQADLIVLPGVGSFRQCRTCLYEKTGLVDALEQSVQEKGRPFLGICVGMHLLATTGFEYGQTSGLDWITGRVQALDLHETQLKSPHMGWNILSLTDAGWAHPVISALGQEEHVYFVHSYHMTDCTPAVMAETHYGSAVTAAVAQDTIIGVQFHPEKSQTAGLRFLSQFLSWRP